VRGESPFLPVHDGEALNTLQLPTTLPTLDELIGRKRGINEFLLASLRNGLNIHTIHAEVEGRVHFPLLEEFLKEIFRQKIETARLCDIAEMTLRKEIGSIPQLPVTRKKIPGRSGWVSCQG